MPAPRHRPPTETWPCPVCDRPVEVESTPMFMKARGYWMAPSGPELIALCAKQNGAHDRTGRPRRPPEPEPEEDERAWQAVEWGPDPEGNRPFVVLVPPGFVLVPSGDGYDVVMLKSLHASDLVGSWERLIASGDRRGHVAGDAVQLDPTESMIDWDYFLSLAGDIVS